MLRHSALDIPSRVRTEFCPEMVGIAHPVGKITFALLTFFAVRDGGPVHSLDPLLELDAVETLQQSCREIPGGTALLSNTTGG